MIVGACVEPEKLARLRGAVGETHRVHAALDWDHADSIIRRQPVDVMVVDPQFGSPEPRTDSIRALRTRFRSVPFVVYSVLAAKTLKPLVELGREGLEHLILFGVDDDPRQLRKVLERQPGVLLSERLLVLLRPRFRSMPDNVTRALERLVHTPAAFHGVSDLATAANVSRRTIYRECERADLASPRELVAGARVLRAYAFLRESDYAIEDVASHLRFSSPHHLTKTMRWACGLTTARARDRLTPEDFVAAVASRLMPTPGTAHAAPDDGDD